MKIVSYPTVGQGVVTVVEHGATGSTARPTGADVVWWVGSATPANAIADDFWVDSASALPSVQSGTWTPTLANANVGTGGAARNEAYYTYVGGPATGDKGLMSITHTLILGSSGGSVSATVTATLPTGFVVDPDAIDSNAQRWGIVTYSAGGVSAFGPILRQGTGTVGYQVYNAASTYLTTSNLSSTVPGSWAAGDSLRAVYTIPVERG